MPREPLRTLDALRLMPPAGHPSDVPAILRAISSCPRPGAVARLAVSRVASAALGLAWTDWTGLLQGDRGTVAPAGHAHKLRSGTFPDSHCARPGSCLKRPSAQDLRRASPLTSSLAPGQPEPGLGWTSKHWTGKQGEGAWSLGWREGSLWERQCRSLRQSLGQAASAGGVMSSRPPAD